jgi:uncharacterized protein (TIGR00369 family)
MDFTVKIPFVELLGLELISFEGGQAEIALSLRDELTNNWSVLHGGALMTLLDVVMAHAARSPNQPGIAESHGVVTVEMKTTFMRPGLGRVVAKGRIVHRSASMAFCEASLFDEAGAIVAQATGTFKYMKGLPAGGKKIHRLSGSD